jgi:alpha-D-ribose 1-methylphosphonate 5-triphosphate synthase subunit PhnI
LEEPPQDKLFGSLEDYKPAKPYLPKEGCSGNLEASHLSDQATKLTDPCDWLIGEGLMESVEISDQSPLGDLTREPLEFPLKRSLRLQGLARADEGFLLSLAYSSQRGYGSVHPFVADLRLGPVEVFIKAPELEGELIPIGQIEVTECRTSNQFKGGEGRPPVLTSGYGLCLGHNERKALSMAIVDRALRSAELGETVKGPVQNEEFVLSHSDNVEASGFVSHIKLPHYVDFQAEMSLIRHMRDQWTKSQETETSKTLEPDLSIKAVAERPFNGQPAEQDKSLTTGKDL